MIALYYPLVIFCIAQRLVELRISKRNQSVLRERGYAFGEGKLFLHCMVGMHVLWFVALLVEPQLSLWKIPPLVSAFAAAVFIAAQGLRVWTQRTLGAHWNISVMRPRVDGKADDEFVAHGPYRYIRHPNYTAIILEFLALPLVGGALMTAILFSILNAFLLRFRIQAEEQGLMARSGYAQSMAGKPRFVPHFFLRPSH